MSGKFLSSTSPPKSPFWMRQLKKGACGGWLGRWVNRFGRILQKKRFFFFFGGGAPLSLSLSICYIIFFLQNCLLLTHPVSDKATFRAALGSYRIQDIQNRAIYSYKIKLELCMRKDASFQKQRKSL